MIEYAYTPDGRLYCLLDDIPSAPLWFLEGWTSEHTGWLAIGLLMSWVLYKALEEYHDGGWR